MPSGTASRPRPGDPDTNRECFPSCPVHTDFLEYELPSIREIFSTRFEELSTPIPGRSDYRILIASGNVVRAYSVIGQLAPNGTVEILQLDLELGWPDTNDDNLGD